MYLVHNEQTKLTATWINTLAAGLIAAGAFAPAAALVLGTVASRYHDGLCHSRCADLHWHGSGTTFCRKTLAWETARMISLEALAVLAPVFAFVVVIGVALFEVWLEDRAERRKAR